MHLMFLLKNMDVWLRGWFPLLQWLMLSIAVPYSSSLLKFYLRTQNEMLHYSLFIHEMSGLFILSLWEEFMCLPLPVWIALFDLRVMPLDCPSCDESRVRWIKVKPDKTGMCFLVISPSFLALRIRLYTYLSCPRD